MRTCDICDLELDGISECEHPKNAYCALFLKSAEKDIKQFGPKHYKTLADLEIGDTFRYKGSDENDWHTVSGKDDEKIYYPGYLPDKPESNYRVENVEVIVK
jgi:hypothetical protein